MPPMNVPELMKTGVPAALLTVPVLITLPPTVTGGVGLTLTLVCEGPVIM
jgi:hypothetical protein